MFRKKDEKWKQFSDLTETMENVGQKNAPDSFTLEVMKRLSEEKEATQSFSIKRSFFPSVNFGFHRYVTKTECAFYFFLTGFFYLILGLIMMIGIPLPVVLENNRWLSVQPFFGILLAVELTAIGIVLFKKGNSAILLVRIGTILYAALIILNFWISSFYIQHLAVVFLIAVFSMTGLVLAALLGLAIDHYYPETISSEVIG